MASSSTDTRDRLLDSALSLFAEKGYEGTSIRELIERAQVTRPVVYYYFEKKEDLFRRLVETWFEELLEDLDRALAKASDYRERLRALMYNAFEYAEREPRVVRLILQVFFSPGLQESHLNRIALWESRFRRVVAVMEEGRDAGDFEGREPEMLAMAFCGVMDMHVMARIQRAHRKLTRELADQLVDLFLRGTVVSEPTIRTGAEST